MLVSVLGVMLVLGSTDGIDHFSVVAIVHEDVLGVVVVAVNSIVVVVRVLVVMSGVPL